MNNQFIRRFKPFITICLLLITACNQFETAINQDVLLISTRVGDIQRIEAIYMDEQQRVSHILDVPSYARLNLSPDGQRLAVWAGKTLTIVAIGNGEQLIELSNVGQTKSEYFNLSSTVWSPDSEKIVYTRDSVNGVALWLYDFLEGQEIQFAHNDAINLYPAWSDDGQEIAYVTNEQCKNGLDSCQNVVWWDIATYSLSTKSREPNRITNFAQSELFPTGFSPVVPLCGLKWSSDGQFIAFEDGCEVYGLSWYRNVYVTSVDGANVWQVTRFNQYSETATRFPNNLFTASYDWMDEDNILWIGYSENELKEGGKIFHDSLMIALENPSEEPEKLQYSNVPISSGTVWSPQKRYILWYSENQSGGTLGNRPRVSEYDKNVFSELDFDSPLPFGTCYQESAGWSLSERYVGYISNSNSGLCSSPSSLENVVITIDLEKNIHKTILTTDASIELLGWTTLD